MAYKARSACIAMSKLLVDAGDGEWMLGNRFHLKLMKILLCALPMHAAAANSARPRVKNVITQGRVYSETKSFSTIAEREKLIIECFRAEIGVTCNFAATYFLNNKADEYEEITGAFLGNKDLRVFQIEHNGNKADVKLTSEQRVAIYDAVKEDLEEDTNVKVDTFDSENKWNTHGVPRYHWDDYRRLRYNWDAYRVRYNRLRFTGFRALFPPGRSTLQFNGQIDLQCWGQGGLALLAIHARHVVSFDEKEQCDILRYPVFPLKTWGGKPQIDIEIIGRDLLDLEVNVDGKRPDMQRTGTWNERQYFHLEGTVPGWLRVVPKYTKSLLGRGGLRFGIGDSPTYGFSGQVGYNYGLGPLFILGVDVTSNFRDYHAAAAMLEFALPNMLLIFPSLSIGAGIPYDFGEGKRFGYRLQTGANFIFIGFQALWDFYREPDGRYEFRNLYFATVSF